MNRAGFGYRAAGAALVLITATATAAMAAESYKGFDWPVPVVHAEHGGWDVDDLGVLGVHSVVPQSVRDKIAAQSYTPSEHRNIQFFLDGLSAPRHTPQKRAAQFKPLVHFGYYVLHGAFGTEGKNGYSGDSLMSRMSTVVDIVAEGDRVVALQRTVGGISGPMFGFKGNGQLIDTYESLSYRFDADGALLSFEPWSGEDLAFYEQLGGKLQFGGDLKLAAAILTGSSVSKAQPDMAAAAAMLGSLDQRGLSVNERHNVDTLLAVAADRGGFDKPNSRFFAKNYRSVETAASPFKTLADINGVSPQLALNAMKDLKRTVTDVLVVGDRSWARILTTAVQTGPLFGVKPTGLPLRWNEEVWLTFDATGKIVEALRLPAQGEIYLDLGGTFTFPYAAYWTCAKCPFGGAQMDIPKN